MNPFKFGGVVGGDDFCNRKSELADLVRAMESCQRTFVYSERRLGKTSLVRLALERLPGKDFIAAYVDLWPTDNETGFATALATAITESISTTSDRLLATARSFFAGLSPSVTLDSEGKPKVSFSLGKGADPTPVLQQVLQSPARIAERGKRRVVIVFDEFQQLLEYGNDHVERQLRSVIQHQQDVAYLFLGSRKHLIRKMFLDEQRPLYRAGAHYPLGPIAEKDWLPFIRRRFADAEKRIADPQIQAVCRLTEGHPFYTQHLCHILWELCESHGRVTDEMLGSAVQVLLDRESYAYTSLWESFSLNQRRFLKGLASEPADVRPFAAEFLGRYSLGSASNAQRAIAALFDRDAIDRNNGSFVILDRFFRLWIQRTATP